MGAPNAEDFGPWSPGLASSIPARLRSKATLFDPKHGLVPWAEAEEMARLTGIREDELATFCARRLAQHRCLIRVTAELQVPDGPRYADLGLNLRAMVSSIFEKGVKPKLGLVEDAFEALRGDILRIVDEALGRLVERPSPPQKPTGLFARLFGGKAAEPVARDFDEDIQSALADLQDRLAQGTGLEAAALKAVLRVCNGAMSRRGRIQPADRGWLATVAVNLVSNTQGDALVAGLVDPMIDEAIQRLGYRRLPKQREPVVLNAKGASASGKSTIRNSQQQIATRLGLDWAHFAIISPDYWRKYLINYDGLGDDFKYAAMLTGQELEIIDKKLDALMAALGTRGDIPHLLIDRFRFDSFHLPGKQVTDSRLLTRFGSKIYMFFMITDPVETVLRAWSRGLETGRYKAVDDLLYHNIEAYSGMPDLFFSWAKVQDRWIHYEFLDNSVPKGNTPRTIACGSNGVLVIADIDRFCDIERYRHVNVEARRPEEVLKRSLDIDEAMAIARRACAELPAVDILVPGTSKPFARARNGEVTLDLEVLPEHIPAMAFHHYDVSDTALAAPAKGYRAEAIGVDAAG